LKSAGLLPDAPTLLTFFHRRATVQPNVGEIEEAIRRLGDEKAMKASSELIGLGAVAIPSLRRAATDSDNVLVAEGARRCLVAIANPQVPAAAARLLGQRRPAGAVTELIGYLPFADNASVTDEVEAVLEQMAISHGKPAEPLLRALDDPLPVRRGAAAAILCHAMNDAPPKAVCKLLHDPKPSVRLRVALGLGTRHDEEAIRELIALLASLPPALAKQAEDFLGNLAGELAPATKLNVGAVNRLACRDAWAAWWKELDDNTLLEFFRKRTPSDADRKRIATLLRLLGDESFEKRERASGDLVALGPPAVPLLREASRTSDVEIVRRAEECLAILEKRPVRFSAITAARLLAARKPAGAVQVLLNFAPFAEGEIESEAIQDALAALTLLNGQPDSVLLRALSDTNEERRAFAAEIMCRGPASDLEPVRRMLADSKPYVRMRASLALLVRGEREAVPTLIGVLGKLSPTDNLRVQETLFRLAGDSVPSAGSGDPASVQVQHAWVTWWNAHGGTVDLRRVDSAVGGSGYTTIGQLDNGVNGRVFEIDRFGRTRWQIVGLQYPYDIQVLPGNRVLLVELHGMKVSERDFRGKVLWQKQFTMPVNCQRLANGNTFVACRNQLLVLDRNRKEITTISRPGHDVLAARKLPSGEIVCLTTTGTCARLNAAGVELSKFSIGSGVGNTIEVLDNGHVLVPQFSRDRVVEYDREGRIVWEAAVTRPMSAQRLSGNRTLVTSQNGQRVMEIDRTGRVVWEFACPGRPVRARRR
jgi:HEAT repeat protein